MNKAKMITIVAVVLVAVTAISLAVFFPSSSDGENTPTNPSLRGEDVESPFRIAIYDLDEYNAFLQTSTDLPDDFVTWDMVKSLGAFCKFSVDKDDSEYERYTYRIYVKNEDILTLTIVPEADLFDGTVQPISTPPEFGATMAQLVNKNKLTGNYESGKLTYGYGNNLLYYIKWAENGVGYTLWAGNTYPYQHADADPDTVLGKLLSVDPEVQLSALNELKAAIENN